MGKAVGEKKKKKGRPSLLDLQKRHLRQQQEEEQQQKQQRQSRHVPKQNLSPSPNPNHTAAGPISPNPARRSTRRNPNPDPSQEESLQDSDTADGDGDSAAAGGGRKRKLNSVLRSPLCAGSYASDSNAEDRIDASNHQKKRKFNAIGGGSAHGRPGKDEKPKSGTNSSTNQKGTQLVSGPSTSLPNKKLLVFILDRLQKKDTYGVFSEPVDPEELPDYHDIIAHPMDFETVRKKLDCGAYANLEQFEKDVFLICSNAMEYNSPDTIYFRQARSIQGLAKKNFEELRQNSDDSEPEPKIVRRGRPPTKNIKKPPGRPPLELAGSKLSDATPATVGESSTPSHYDMRKGPSSDKNSPADSSGRGLYGPQNSEAHTIWSSEQKLKRNEEFTGSPLKVSSLRHVKKQSVFDENRRNTYLQSHSAAGSKEESVLTTFDGEKKQLMAVGLLAEFGYARSLARFAAALGPVAWKIASKKIERSLPAGLKFGPGWVGENEAAPQRVLPVLPPVHSQMSPSQPLPLPRNSYLATRVSPIEAEGNDSQDRTQNNSAEIRVPSDLPGVDGHQSKRVPSSASLPPASIAPNRSSELCVASEKSVRGLNSNARFNTLHQRFAAQSSMNGLNGTYGINVPAQMGKPVAAVYSSGSHIPSSQVSEMISRTNAKPAWPATLNGSSSQDHKFQEKLSKTNCSVFLANPGCEGSTSQRAALQLQSSSQASSPQQRMESVPPDLNALCQAEGSPCTSRADSKQPDLALQL